MEDQPAVRSGAYLVRAWIEDGSVRARITETLDITGRHRTTHEVAGTDEIESLLRDWLEALTTPTPDE